MRALFLSILVSFTACITGDNVTDDLQPADDIEEQGVVDVEDLPPLAHEPTQATADRLDSLDTVLDAFLVRARPLPHKVGPGPSLPLDD